MTLQDIPSPWRPALRSELEQPYAAGLSAFLAAERARHEIFPSEGEVFRALRLTPPSKVRVVLLGQDPYHGAGQAHGLAFSVRPGVRPPPSLKNIFGELHADLGCPVPGDGSLEPWARQGVLLLNTVLTVREGAAASHRGRGWERITDAVIRAVAARPQPTVFLLWGAHAQAKTEMIDPSRHMILAAPHPSPLSAKRGFFGSRPFSRANAALAAAGLGPIDWCLP